MPTTDDIADRLLSADLDLARFEAGERRRVLTMVQQLGRDIVLLLDQRNPAAVTRQSFQERRLQAMLPEVTEAIRQAYRSLARTQAENAREIAVLTGTETANIVNTTMEANLLTVGLSEARLRALADDLVIEGAPAREWWARQAATMRQQWHDAMRQGLLLGESLPALIRRTRRITRTASHHAEALVRTAIISSSNSARIAVYDANPDDVAAIQWLTSFDTDVCPICRALSAKKWTAREHRPVGHRLPFPGVVAHYQ